MSSADEETPITEITIAPDGRIYVFGASAEVLEVMGSLDSQNAELRKRIDESRKTAPASSGNIAQNRSSR